MLRRSIENKLLSFSIPYTCFCFCLLLLDRQFLTENQLLIVFKEDYAALFIEILQFKSQSNITIATVDIVIFSVVRKNTMFCVFSYRKIEITEKGKISQDGGNFLFYVVNEKRTYTIKM